MLGDVFDAVDPTERFDLITANPPFVPSPVDELRFRDGGRSGEAVQRRIVAGLPHYLAPGGIAQLVTEIGERENEPIVSRVRQWLEGAPMDIHIIRLRAHTAADYAIGHGSGDGDFGFYLDSVGAWAENLRAHGYARVVSVLVAFRWSDPSLGPPWDRVDESQPPRRQAGAEVEAVFGAERTARQPNREQVLDRARVRRAGPIALQEQQVLGSEVHAKARATLLGQAFTMEHQLDAIEREILRRLESSVAVSELLAAAKGSSAAETTIRAAIDSLLRRGLVTVSG